MHLSYISAIAFRLQVDYAFCYVTAYMFLSFYYYDRLQLNRGCNYMWNKIILK